MDARQQAAADPPRRRRPLRMLGWLLMALLLLLLAALAGFVGWARTDGSLATALRLAGEHLPLTARGASGALLGSGEIKELVWDSDGLRVDVSNAVLDWRPRELLSRRLHVVRLSADRIVVDDQAAPDEDQPASSGLPDSLALPLGLRVDVDDVQAGEILLKGPPDRSLHDIHARYHYDGAQHALQLLSASYKDDANQATVQARATVGARAPMPVSARLSAAASARLPDAVGPALAALQLDAAGTLEDLQVQLRMQGTPAPADSHLQLPPLPQADADLEAAAELPWPVSADTTPLRMNATARLRPNDALPLQQAHAELDALDLSAFLPDAPRTQLSARLDATPLAPTRAGGQMGLVLRARVSNDDAGPWDAHRLPVDQLTADAQWQDGVATVQQLLLDAAGGQLQASGSWHGSASGSGASHWQVQGRITQLDPSLLHSELAAFPIDGTISAQGKDADADFELALDAAQAPASATDAAATPADAHEDDDKGQAMEAQPSSSEQLAAQLRALALRQLRVTGQWADSVLTLSQLQVQTDDARLAGQARVDLAVPAQPAVDSQLALQAPGLALQLETAQLGATSGSGNAALDVSDAAALLEWARRLPAAADALAGAQASGNGKLDADVDGGWLQPTLDARLDIPTLDLTLPAADGSASPIQLRGLDATAAGTLEDAQLALHGRVLQPAQQVDMQLALDAAGGWADQVLTLAKLQLNAGDASAAGSARVDLSDVFDAVADLQVNAPGLAATVKGNLAPEAGDGRLQLALSDAAATLRWARTLPGAAHALAGASASGTAQLDARWQGGLDNPRVDARLDVPRLDYVASDDASSLSVRELQASLAGDLAQARLTVDGHVVQGERKVDLKLAANGGRDPDHRDAWHVNLNQLAAQLQLPELGPGQWEMASRNPVPISWRPANGGQLDVGAGELGITSPAPRRQSRIIWEPLRWHDGQLHSAGRITELPLEWAQRIAGEQLEDAGISGDIVLAGQWDIQMGRQLKLDARLERVSGDLDVSVNAGDSSDATVPAGLRQASVELSSSGGDVRLDVTWDSARAGTVDGQLSTRLTAAQGADGQTRWQWSDQAPLTGHLKAALPEISVWSLLAPPGWRLHGSLAADVRVSGSAAQPQLAGTLSANDLALRSVVDGVQLEDGRLRAHLQGTRLVIDEFILHGAGNDDGGGSIRVTGEAGLLDGELAVRIHAVIDHLHASVRDDREVIASGNINAAFRDQTVSASGKLVVDRAHIVLPDESRPSLGSDVYVHGLGEDDRAAIEQNRNPGAKDEAAQARERARDAAEASPLNADIDIQINMGEDFRVSGMGINTRLAGELVLTAKGPLAQMPTLNGRVETVGGTYRAYGQHLSIERGRIFFSGDASNPALDILALRPNYASDQKVGALIQGTALLPQVKLYSRPTLPDDQVLAWLILGHPAPQDGGEAALMQTAALALLGGRESEGLASSFGLDELSFGSGNGEGLAGASVTLGKRLSDRLYTAYEHSLSGTGGVLMIFYELSRRWVLRAQASQSSAIDLIYRLSYD